jgi:hypothetical protein
MVRRSRSGSGTSRLLGVGLVALVIASLGCKDELQGKTAADPLEDPWVAGIETGGEEPLAEASEASTDGGGSGLEGDPAQAEETSAAGSLALAQPSSVATDAPESAGGSALGAQGDGPAPSAAQGSASQGGPASGSSSGPPDQPQADPGQANPADGGPPSPVEPGPAATPQAAPTTAPTTAPPEPAAPPPLTIADYHGRYRYTGGSTQTAARDAAIEVTVDALASAIRGIARRRLTGTNPIENSIEIIVAGDQVTTTFESGVTATCTVDGGTVDARDIEGGKLRVRVRWQNGKLVQQMQGKGGARTTVYTLSSDRKRLTVHHKITSPRLPEPLVYKLSFTRK